MQLSTIIKAYAMFHGITDLSCEGTGTVIVKGNKLDKPFRKELDLKEVLGDIFTPDDSQAIPDKAV